MAEVSDDKAFGVFGDAVLDTNLIVGVAGGLAYMAGGVVVPVGEEGQREAREWVAGLYAGEEAGDGDEGENGDEAGENGENGDDGEEDGKRSWRRVTEEDVEEWAEWRDEKGMSISQIAQLAGRSWRVVQGHLKARDEALADVAREEAAEAEERDGDEED